jgi:hypothetical protein
VGTVTSSLANHATSISGCAIVATPSSGVPQNRRSRVLWLFDTAATYRAMPPALRAIGRAAFLREV